VVSPGIFTREETAAGAHRIRELGEPQTVLKAISYKGFSQHNNKTTIMFIVLQRHVSTHTSHLQARTIFLKL
jgi:hypothetical protein